MADAPIAAGEYAENEMPQESLVTPANTPKTRCARTSPPSERVAILETINRKPLGDQARSADLPTVANASKRAGFEGERTARNAATVVKLGVPELIAAMDKDEIAIDAVAIGFGHLMQYRRQLIAPTSRAADHMSRHAPVFLISWRSGMCCLNQSDKVKHMLASSSLPVE